MSTKRKAAPSQYQFEPSITELAFLALLKEATHPDCEFVTMPSARPPLLGINVKLKLGSKHFVGFAERATRSNALRMAESFRQAVEAAAEQL